MKSKRAKAESLQTSARPLTAALTNAETQQEKLKSAIDASGRRSAEEKLWGGGRTCLITRRMTCAKEGEKATGSPSLVQEDELVQSTGRTTHVNA